MSFILKESAGSTLKARDESDDGKTDGGVEEVEVDGRGWEWVMEEDQGWDPVGFCTCTAPYDRPLLWVVMLLSGERTLGP